MLVCVLIMCICFIDIDYYIMIIYLYGSNDMDPYEIIIDIIKLGIYILIINNILCIVNYIYS